MNGTNITAAIIDCDKLQLNNFTSWLNLDESIKEECFSQFCEKNFGLGNPDITGIGMLGGYIMSNFLAFSMCAGVFISIFLTRHRKPNYLDDPKGHKHITALVNALIVYLDSSTYLAFAVIVATAVNTGEIWKTGTINLSENRQYNSTALMASIICLAPCIPCLFVVQWLGKRVGVRIFIVLTANLLFLGMVVSSIFVKAHQTGGWRAIYHGTDTSDLLDVSGPREYCFGKKAAHVLDGLYIFFAWMEFCTFGVLILFSVSTLRDAFAFVLHRIFPSLKASIIRPSGVDVGSRRTMQRRNDTGDSRMDYPVWLEIVAFFVLPLFAAVISLASMIWQRIILSRFWADDYEDNKWGFGQVVAILIFMPVLIEYIYTMIFGEEEAMGGRIPKGYIVVNACDFDLQMSDARSSESKLKYEPVVSETNAPEAMTPMVPPPSTHEDITPAEEIRGRSVETRTNSYKNDYFSGR